MARMRDMTEGASGGRSPLRRLRRHLPQRARIKKETARDRSRAVPFQVSKEAYASSAMTAGSGSIASSRCWASCSSRLAATRCRLRR